MTASSDAIVRPAAPAPLNFFERYLTAWVTLCIVVGIARAAAVQLFPEIELFVIYALMVAVLFWKPQGLFPARG